MRRTTYGTQMNYYMHIGTMVTLNQIVYVKSDLTAIER